MSEDLSGAVQLAILEKAHRQAVVDVMQSDLGDVERVVKVLALEAEYLGVLEKLRVARETLPGARQDESADNRG